MRPFPAPSLRELARPTGVTEGVSSDGSTGPTIYTRAYINSEIFEGLRSSKYTPSVSHSLDSSLREGAGRGAYHSTGYSLTSGVTGDFHRPYEAQKILGFIIQRAARKPGGGGRFSSPLRNSEDFTFHHTTDRSKTSGFHPGTIPGGAGHPRMGTSLMRN